MIVMDTLRLNPQAGTLIASVVFRLLVLAATTSSAAVSQPANPPRLDYATYIGPVDIGQAQTGSSYLFGVAAGSNGSAYMVGAYAGCGAMLTKLNRTGTATTLATCLPMQNATAFAADPGGYIYLAGYNGTASTGGSPTTTLIKITPDGQTTVYSTAIPGVFVDKVALDKDGNAYLAGRASSGFQPTSGAYMTSGGSNYVLKLSPAGNVVYATYLDLFAVSGIAVDSKGQAWVVGSADCQILVSYLQKEPCGPSIGATKSGIRKLDAAGSHALVSMNVGGGGISGDFAANDRASAVALDATDAAWIAGTSQSRRLLPTTANALDSTGNGPGALGYAMKLSSTGALLYGTYLGSNRSPQQFEYIDISSVAVDAQGRPYFALNGPTPWQALLENPGTIMALSADGSSLLLSADDLQAPIQILALDGNGGLYAAGSTWNRGFVATPGSYIPLYPAPQYWGPEGFVARFDLTTKAPSGRFSGLVNAATFWQGYPTVCCYGEGVVSPGEIVTILGTNLPANPKVTFDGRPVPILYSSPSQINTVVPFEVTAPSTVVSIEGVRGYVLPVWPAVPGLFTANGSGSGQLAALNQDGAVNSAANPAKAGSIVSVFMTGAGALSPAIGDGQPGPLNPPYPAPVLGTSAIVGNKSAPIIFIGQAPGLIAGCIQVNVQIPPDTPSGNARLVVCIGAVFTQAGLIAIQ